MAYRLVLRYAFVRRESEQNSSLQLLQGAAVEVLRFSPLGCSLDQLLCTHPCHVIGGDSDTFASIKRREFVPFALAACLAAAVPPTKVIVTSGLAQIVASAIAMGLGGYLGARTDAEH